MLTMPSGGKRIFPDWPAPSPTPSPQEKYQRVKVKATIKPAISERTVYFSSFDVDDPSAQAAPIDDEGSPEDNRGSPKSGEIEGDAFAHTDGAGVAQRVFKVTLQPGDNFRIVAYLRATDFGVITKCGDDRGRLYFPNHTEEVFIPDDTASVEFFKATPMLTVWRRLKAERDRIMDTPQYEIVDEKQRLVFGYDTGSSYRVCGEKSIWDDERTDFWTSNPNLYDDVCYIRLLDAPGAPKCFPITGIDDSIMRLFIDNTKLYYNDEQPYFFNFDMSGEWNLLLCDLRDDYSISSEDSPINVHFPPVDGIVSSAFQEAYILVEGREGVSDVLDWQKYVDGYDLVAIGGAYSSRVRGNSYYWNVYVLGAYESSEGRDNDPDEPEPGGRVGLTGCGYSAVFYEQLRDIKMMTVEENMDTLMQIDTAHEIMHQCGETAHSSGPYIMNADIAESYTHFEPAHIAFV